MPRRPENRKPEPKRPLQKKDLDRLDKIEAEAEILSVDERACAHLATEYSKEQAATVLGWTLSEVNETLNLPHVRLYLKKADEAFLGELAKAKVRRMVRVGISRATIEQRLMELAQMPPEDTKGRIDGQVKALATLAKMYGLLSESDDEALKRRLEKKTPEELQGIIIKAAAGMLPGPASDRPQ